MTDKKTYYHTSPGLHITLMFSIAVTELQAAQWRQVMYKLLLACIQTVIYLPYQVSLFYYQVNYLQYTI